VSVPVLSKHMIVTFPQILTFGGEMQKIYYFLSLDIANEIPMERHVGRAGGTVIVTKSRLLRIKSRISKNPSSSPSIINGSATKNPSREIIAKTAMNRNESA